MLELETGTSGAHGELHDLVVIGAGPAGLAEAFWALRAEPHRRVAVLESAAQPGGWVRTEEVDGFRLELGPQALRPSDTLDAVLDALGMKDEVVPAAASAKLRHVGRGGRLIPVPTGPGAFLGTPLLPLSAKLRLLTEPFRRARADVDPTESISSFVGRRFGRHTVPLVQAVVSGIFAGDADHLEVGSAFPVLAEAEREHGSVFSGMKARARAARAARGGAPRRGPRPALLSFRHGMRTLTDRLASEIGDSLELGVTAERVTSSGDSYRIALSDGRWIGARELVLACPARVASELLADIDGQLAADLGGIPFASLASVYLDLDAAQIPATMRGFGFLLQPGEGSEVLGGLSCSDVFPDHAPAGRFLCRMMMGGRRFPELVDRSDDDLVELASTTLATYTGYRGSTRAIRVARVRSAIPQYEEGHHARLGRIGARLRERHPALRLRGNSYRAIALTGQLGTPTLEPV